MTSFRAESNWPPVVVASVFQTGLNLMRDLLRRGVRTVGIDCDSSHEGFRSSYGKSYLCPNPDTHPDDWIAFMIRLAQTKKARQAGTWRQILEAEGLAVNSSTAYLEPERIGDLRVASDYRIEGMAHHYRTSGLGVPLVAHRWTDQDDSKSIQEQFFPREMRIGATAVCSPSGSDSSERSRPSFR